MKFALKARPDRLRIFLRVVVLAGAAGALASCSLGGNNSAGSYSSTGSGITASGPIPKGGGYEMVGRPYTIRGVQYVPQEDPNYSRVGTASWYGADFHGLQTANGERYDMTALTAAHPTLPLPSYVRVTNLANDSSIVVRINDRGPFANDRVIDMSAQAANLLGFYDAGVARVRVDYIGRAPLEGDDTRMLMATYNPPGGTANTAIAYNEQTRQVAVTATAARRPFNPFANGAAVAAFSPTAVPTGADPLADLAGLGYAPQPTLSPVQQAIQEMATADRTAAAQTGDVVLQIGVFGDPANVDRIRGFLESFGIVTVSEMQRGDHTLWSVRLTTEAGTADAAIAAAIGVGATGAQRL